MYDLEQLERMSDQQVDKTLKLSQIQQIQQEAQRRDNEVSIKQFEVYTNLAVKMFGLAVAILAAAAAIIRVLD